MRNLFLCFVAVLALGLAGCSTSHPPANASATGATNLAQLPPQPYTRVAYPDSNTVQLQIALRKFVPAKHRGPVIWLAGTSHIGDPDYYRTLQKHLDAQTVVLYEGINSDAHKFHLAKPGVIQTNSPTPPGPGGTNEGFSMQSALAESLGLVFQLDAIDYDRTNFLNSDLSVLQIERLMIGDTNAVPAAPGQKGVSSPSLDALLHIMDGTSFLGSLFKMGVQFIGSNPSLQAITKLTFIETIGGLKGDFAEIRGLPPDMQQLLRVLIEARNQNVIDDLKAECKILPRSASISVFYGTGHMDDMEKRVIRDLHYRPDGDLWLTAFSVDTRRTGLSPSEMQMMKNLVKWQLNQMQPQ